MNNEHSNPLTDSFDDVELKAEMERKESSYPKNEDGSVDLDSMTSDEQASYWKDRHDASTRGFHQYKAKTDKEIAELRVSPTLPSKEVVEKAVSTTDTLEDFEKAIPDFEFLDASTQASLKGMFMAMDKRVSNALNNDVGVAMARKTFNTQKWEEAFNNVSAQFGGDLVSVKNEFKAKYFNPTVAVPSNIEQILTDLAKAFLYDTAKERGAKEALDDAGRVSLERSNGGIKEAPSGMSIDDWERLRKTNPLEFARRSKEFNDALNSGKLNE